MDIQNTIRSRVFVAMALAASVAIPVALASPVTVNPGDSNLAIPTYSGSVPSYTLLGTTGIQTASSGVGTLFGFDEIAFKSSTLDPYGPNAVSFAFVVASTASGPLTLSMTGFTGYSTQVEACDPLAIVAGQSCSGPGAGTVSRTAGGSTLNFGSMGLTAATFDGFSANVSNIYGIFTNASGVNDPGAQVCLPSASVATCASFSSLGLTGSTTTSVPEPSTLALFGFGLAGIGFGFMRRKRAI
ncbi:MAG TPA: PEP-CTERM sorting domain-containing protein [Steroidobacteraceae bacterium]|nr:PEP-CTERM sorting domain-containing protein [Steroidobacteraceae bacterium]